MLRVNTAPEQLKAPSHQAFSCLGWQKGFEGLHLGMVSWKVLLWSGVGGEQWAAVQEIGHHVPAAPKTAQIPEVEGAGGRRGVGRHLQGEPVLQPPEFPARIDPERLL